MNNLEEIKGRRANINITPWRVDLQMEPTGWTDDMPDGAITISGHFKSIASVPGPGYLGLTGRGEEDADFIANAPSDIDFLVARIEELEKHQKDYEKGFWDGIKGEGNFPASSQYNRGFRRGEEVKEL